VQLTGPVERNCLLELLVGLQQVPGAITPSATVRSDPEGHMPMWTPGAGLPYKRLPSHPRGALVLQMIDTHLPPVDKRNG